MPPITHIIIPVADDTDAIRTLRWLTFITPNSKLKKARIVLVGLYQPVDVSVREAARIPFVSVDVTDGAVGDTVAAIIRDGGHPVVLDAQLPTANNWLESGVLLPAPDPEGFIKGVLDDFFLLSPLEVPLAPLDGTLFYALSDIAPGFTKQFQTRIPLATLAKTANVRGRVYQFGTVRDGIVEAKRVK